VDGLITRRQQIRLLLQIIRELIDERDALELEVERLQSDQASRRWQEEQ
jgi:cell division protein FtsL